MDKGGDKQFIGDEVRKIINDSINSLFGIKEDISGATTAAAQLQLQQQQAKISYSKEKASANINNLIDLVIRGLSKLNKPFKYNVSAVIMQNEPGKDKGQINILQFNIFITQAEQGEVPTINTLLQPTIDYFPIETYSYDSAVAYNDPNTDGMASLQRQVGDNVVVVTVFAMQL